MHEELVQIVKSHTKQKDFIDSFKEIISQVKNAIKVKSEKQYTIKQCWTWFKLMVEEYLRLKKNEQTEERLSDKLIRVMGTRQRGDLPAKFSEMMV